jgi:hypothetical protein
MTALTKEVLSNNVASLISYLTKEYTKSYNLAEKELRGHYQSTQSKLNPKVDPAVDYVQRQTIAKQNFFSWIKTTDSAAYLTHLQRLVKLHILIEYLRAFQKTLTDENVINALNDSEAKTFGTWNNNEPNSLQNTQYIFELSSKIIAYSETCIKDRELRVSANVKWQKFYGYGNYILIPLTVFAIALLITNILSVSIGVTALVLLISATIMVNAKNHSLTCQSKSIWQEKNTTLDNLYGPNKQMSFRDFYVKSEISLVDRVFTPNGRLIGANLDVDKEYFNLIDKNSTIGKTSVYQIAESYFAPQLTISSDKTSLNF